VADERNARLALQASTFGPRLSVLSIDYDDQEEEVTANLMFHNDGSVQCTIISVSFLYRANSFQAGWDFIRTGPRDAAFYGHINPIKLPPRSEEIRRYKANVEPQKFHVRGAEIALHVNFSVPGRPNDAATIIALQIVDSPLTQPARNMPRIDRLLLRDNSEWTQLASLIKGIGEPLKPNISHHFLTWCSGFFDY
jgi:hypothetical protein